jgi:hypothetical protein
VPTIQKYEAQAIVLMVRLSMVRLSADSSKKNSDRRASTVCHKFCNLIIEFKKKRVNVFVNPLSGKNIGSANFYFQSGVRQLIYFFSSSGCYVSPARWRRQAIQKVPWPR